MDAVAGHDRQVGALSQVAEVAQPFIVIRSPIPAEFNRETVGSEERDEFAQGTESPVRVIQGSTQGPLRQPVRIVQSPLIAASSSRPNTGRFFSPPSWPR